MSQSENTTRKANLLIELARQKAAGQNGKALLGKDLARQFQPGAKTQSKPKRGGRIRSGKP